MRSQPFGLDPRAAVRSQALRKAGGQEAVASVNGKLFLSHSRQDKREAQALRRALEDRGVAVWEDAWSSRPGTAWPTSSAR